LPRSMQEDNTAAQSLQLHFWSSLPAQEMGGGHHFNYIKLGSVPRMAPRVINEPGLKHRGIQDDRMITEIAALLVSAQTSHGSLSVSGECQ
jgi:hypothetical protein